MLCFVGLHACLSVILPWLFFYVPFLYIFFIALLCLQVKPKLCLVVISFLVICSFLFSLLTDMKHVLYNKYAFDFYTYNYKICI